MADVKPQVRKKTLETILTDRGFVDAEKLAQAQKMAKEGQLPLQQVIINQGWAKKTDMLLALSQEWGVKAIDLSEIEVDQDVVKIVPEAAARRQHVLPFAKEENVMYVAMTDPRDFFVVEDIRLRTGFDVQAYLALPGDIEDVLNKVYGQAMLSKITASIKTDDQVQVIQETKEESRVDITDIEVDTPEVEKMVNAVLLGALELKASDIHIEPFEAKIITRYRIDGVLQEAPFQPPLAYRNALISKLKIMTQSMDITERRRPQDGRIRLNAGNRPIELRVNILPTVFGESCCMRILDRSSIRVELHQLGFLPDTLERIMASVGKPNGIILVTGPTGSGKSTTLYAVLNAVNTPDTKILTAENPVEYNLEGVVQVNVNQEIGFDFSAALRAFLRQDPDIIMVGEIRDKETATIAMEAAMTGHLVFSTLHTNDAPTAIGRLADMGVLPFLIASTLEGVLAQRLVRRVCKECKEPAPMTDDVAKVLTEAGLDPGQAKLVRGKGCPVCNNTGYKGRAGIHEFLYMDDMLRSLILKEVATGPVKELAIKNGMRSLYNDGLIKAAQGVTTIDEILRAAKVD
ncbi:MAG: ATPase, T2SS/T4P/T4SS family [Elusimicrobiota bacterium]